MPREEFPINRIRRIIHQKVQNPHNPAYLGYDIGTSFAMGLGSGRTVLAYYAGFTGEDTIKLGTSKVPGHIFDSPHSTYPILYTRELQVKETIQCKTDKELRHAFDNLDHLTMIEFQYGDNEDNIRRIGFFKKTGTQSPTLAHSHSLRKRRVDTWYRPLFVPSSRWFDPDRRLSLEGIREIRILEEV